MTDVLQTVKVNRFIAQFLPFFCVHQIDIFIKIVNLFWVGGDVLREEKNYRRIHLYLICVASIVLCGID